LKSKLAEISVELEEISSVVIGHEHIDHVKGLQTFSKNMQIPIYLSNGTWQAVDEKFTIKDENIKIIKSGEQLNYDDLILKFHTTSHDANEPLAFSFHYFEDKYIHITDTGYVTDNLEKISQNANLYLIESNYEDDVIIQNPKYPFLTKKRIISEKGHLSNMQCNAYLKKVVGDKTKLICFAHLSENNNTDELVDLENKKIEVEKVIFQKDKIVEVEYASENN